MVYQATELEQIVRQRVRQYIQDILEEEVAPFFKWLIGLNPERIHRLFYLHTF
jgi:hypothetical protein